MIAERTLQAEIKKAILIGSSLFYPVQLDVNLVPYKGGMISNGATRGTADFYVQGPRALGFWLEVKTAKGKQSAYQQIFQYDIEHHGGFYYLVRSITEALDACMDFCQRCGIQDVRLNTVWYSLHPAPSASGSGARRVDRQKKVSG